MDEVKTDEVSAKESESRLLLPDTQIAKTEEVELKEDETQEAKSPVKPQETKNEKVSESQEVLESLEKKLKGQAKPSNPSLRMRNVLERSQKKSVVYAGIIGGGVLVMGVIGLLVTALWNRPTVSTLPGNGPGARLAVEVPTVPLFGFWQKGKRLDWYLARIANVEGRTFRIRWQGNPQTDGKGLGTGEGKGTIKPDNTVSIDIDEQVRTESGADAGPFSYLNNLAKTFTGGGQTTQLLHLEGVFVPQSKGRSYFKGTYMERGGKFYPFSSWVLSPDLPKGWQSPGGAG
jgi:hypothetical protein